MRVFQSFGYGTQDGPRAGSPEMINHHIETFSNDSRLRTLEVFNALGVLGVKVEGDGYIRAE